MCGLLGISNNDHTVVGCHPSADHARKANHIQSVKYHSDLHHADGMFPRIQLVVFSVGPLIYCAYHLAAVVACTMVTFKGHCV
jgi:hypothetical protein